MAGIGLPLSEIGRMRKKVIELYSSGSTGETVESEIEALLELISILNSCGDGRALPESLAVYLRNWSDCESVGIRLRYGYDYPYYLTSGFSERFRLLENTLCSSDDRGHLKMDDSGHPVLECMCGNVISGRFDPGLDFFTENGSFWTNSTTALLKSRSMAGLQLKTRNRCNKDGYESVALIPLRYARERFGLLQFNGRGRGRFSPRKIALLERIAANITFHLAGHRDEIQSLLILNEKEILLHKIFKLLKCEPVYAAEPV